MVTEKEVLSEMHDYENLLRLIKKFNEQLYWLNSDLVNLANVVEDAYTADKTIQAEVVDDIYKRVADYIETVKQQLEEYAVLEDATLANNQWETLRVLINQYIDGLTK